MTGHIAGLVGVDLPDGFHYRGIDDRVSDAAKALMDSP
jgi:hypothetical protein